MLRNSLLLLPNDELLLIALCNNLTRFSKANACEKGIIHVTFLSLLFFFHRMRALLLLLWGANRIVNNKNLGFSHIYFFVLILVTPYVCAQAPETASDATVTYPAEYFAQFNPYSVNDMLQRIPGISRAQR